jgi:hypothetical protein
MKSRIQCVLTQWISGFTASTVAKAIGVDADTARQTIIAGIGGGLIETT